MMFSLLSWILMCAAFCIQSGTSSNAGVSDPLVSLKCNKTVEVVARERLRLNCTIQLLGENCRGDEFVWEDSNNNIICNSTTYKTVNYSCKWDGETYVSLDIEEVTKNQTYTVHILTDCGDGHSSITVKVMQPHVPVNKSIDPTPTPNPEEDSSLVTVTVIGSVFIIVLVLGILSALFTTRRGKEILKRVKREKNPKHVAVSQACLVNSGV